MSFIVILSTKHTHCDFFFLFSNLPAIRYGQRLESCSRAWHMLLHKLRRACGDKMNVCVDSLKSRRHADQMYIIKCYNPRICLCLAYNTCDDTHSKYRVRIRTFTCYNIMKYLRFYLFIYIYYVIYFDGTSFYRI